MKGGKFRFERQAQPQVDMFYVNGTKLTTITSDLPNSHLSGSIVLFPRKATVRAFISIIYLKFC